MGEQRVCTRDLRTRAKEKYEEKRRQAGKLSHAHSFIVAERVGRVIASRRIDGIAKT